MRYKVTVVGAGNVGATCAQLIAQADLADVVMVDVAADLADRQGPGHDGVGPGRSASTPGSPAAATTTPPPARDVCVVTAGLARKPGMSRDDLLAKNTEIVSEVVRQLVSRSPETILIIVTNPLDAMCEVARRVSGFPRERVLGMAGVLDAARMRWFIAEELERLGRGRRRLRARRPRRHHGAAAALRHGQRHPAAAAPRRRDDRGDQRPHPQRRRRDRQLLQDRLGLLRAGRLLLRDGRGHPPRQEEDPPLRRLPQGRVRLRRTCSSACPASSARGGMERVIELKLTVEEKGMLDRSAQAVKSLVEGLPKG